MKSVLLINPPDLYITEGKRGDRPPLGLLSVAAYLKNSFNDLEIEIWDINHDTYKEDKITMFDFVCFGTNTPAIKWVWEKASKLKEKRDRPIIVFGGNHVTDFPNEPETLSNADYIIIGEAEEVMRKIVSGEFETKGVKKEEVIDESLIPIPAYELIDMQRYTMQIEGKKAMMVITARGCRYACAYCGSAKIKRLRERNLNSVKKELELLWETYDVRSFYFGDDIFTFNKERTINFCEMLMDSLPYIEYRCTTRADLLDDDICAFLAQSGCKVVSLGIESGANEILKKIHKGMTVEQQRAGVELLHKYGIKVKGFFIIGLPGETAITAQATVGFAKSLDLEYVDFYPYTPYPSTPIWDNPGKYGLEIDKKHIDWQNVHQLSNKMVFKHPNLTEKEIMNYVEEGRKIRTGLTYV